MNQDGYAEQTSGTVIGGSGGYDLNFWTMDIDTYNGTWSGAGIGVIAVEVYAGTDATPIYGEVDFNWVHHLTVLHLGHGYIKGCTLMRPTFRMPISGKTSGSRSGTIQLM